jgi:hypothetical protein
MKIQFVYSHLNGLEWLLHHHPKLWDEINDSVKAVNAEKCKTKTSKEKTMKGKMLFSPIDMNSEMKIQFEERGWSEERYTYYVTDDHKITRQVVNLPSADQKLLIEKSGAVPILSYHQTDFVKNRVSVEVQFGKYPFIEFDLFVKHLGFFVGDEIDLGIEIIPTKALQSDMSSGPGYYERTLSHILRQGRGNPSVPLIIIGVEA